MVLSTAGMVKQTLCYCVWPVKNRRQLQKFSKYMWCHTFRTDRYFNAVFCKYFFIKLNQTKYKHKSRWCPPYDHIFMFCYFYINQRLKTLYLVYCLKLHVHNDKGPHTMSCWYENSNQHAIVVILNVLNILMCAPMPDETKASPRRNEIPWRASSPTLNTP